MKRIIPLVIVLAAASVLAQQAIVPSTRPTASSLLQSMTSALRAAGPTSAPESSHSRSDYSRSRRFEADTRPSSGPQGVLIPPPKPLSPDYAILTERSMFVKGAFRYPTPGAYIRPSHSSTSTTSQSAWIDPLESNLVLTGIMEVDDGFVAFIENYSSGEIHTLRSGDAIAKGKLGSMTLNYMNYIANGHTTQVSLGRTLLNGDPPATRPFAAGSTVAPDSPSSSAGGSSGVGALPPPSDSLIERLKKRREAEGAGK